MVAAWLLFPAVMLVVCLGCGLLVEFVTGTSLPGALLPSLGLAVLIVVGSLTTSYEKTTGLTVPAVLVLTIAGYAVARGRLRSLRPVGWAVAVALGVFVVCAAPQVLSGNASFLGYFVLNDAIFHFSLITQLLGHAHDLSHLSTASAYRALLQDYLSTSYPTGADVALGAMRPLVGQDVAWLLQPYLAVIMAFGGLAVWELLRDVFSSRGLRALAAFVAAQAGLLYAYYLQASIKELATAWLTTVLVVVVIDTLTGEQRPRRLVPAALLAVAGFYVLDLAIAPWIGPPLAVLIVVAAWRVRRSVRTLPRRRLALTAAGIVLALAILAGPIVGRVSTFVTVAGSVLTSATDLGNLAHELPHWELFGIWPNGDFRFSPVNLNLSFVLIGVALTSAGLGVAWAIRRRRYAPLLLLAGNTVAALFLFSRASPYASAKVMVIVSLSAVTAEMLGAAALHDSGRRIEAWGLALVITAGVLWTNVLGYHDASVAPRARLAELSVIGNRYAGQGPAFFNLSDEYAAYFLRNEAPTDPAIGPPQARPGLPPPPGRTAWDPDDLALNYAESFRLFVLGRSPLRSRPPANYQLADAGRYYEVWRRTGTPQVLAHVPLGTALSPAAVPSCRLVRSIAERARHMGAELATVLRPAVATLIPTHTTRPPNWGLDAADPFVLIPRDQAGAMTGTLTAPATGRYDLDVEANLSQKLLVTVDGHRVGSIEYQLGPPGQVIRVATIALAAGSHPIAVIRPANNLTPGDGGTSRTIGLITLSPAGSLPAVTVVSPGRARSLCGRRLDWLEIVRS